MESRQERGKLEKDFNNFKLASSKLTWQQPRRTLAPNSHDPSVRLPHLRLLEFHHLRHLEAMELSSRHCFDQNVNCRRRNLWKMRRTAENK